MIEMIPFAYYLALFLFIVGLVIVITKKNTIFVLMGIELMLNGAHINLIVASLKHNQPAGQMMVIFTIVLAAAEAAIGLALLLRLYRYRSSSDLTHFDKIGH